VGPLLALRGPPHGGARVAAPAEGRGPWVFGDMRLFTLRDMRLGAGSDWRKVGEGVGCAALRWLAGWVARVRQAGPERWRRRGAAPP